MLAVSSLLSGLWLSSYCEDLKVVNNIFSNPFRMSELLVTLFTADELFGVILWFVLFFFYLHFKSSLQLLQLFSRTLQLCFTVKLQRCSVDTSPDFISSGGRR